MVGHFLQYAFSVFFVMGIFLSSVFLSRLVPGRYFIAPSALFAFLLRAGCGMILISGLLFLVYAFHLGNLLNVRVIAGLLCFLGAIEMINLFKTNRVTIGSFSSWPFWIAASYFLISGFWSVLPASEKDELIYHLEIPRQMLAQGEWILWRDNIYGFFPHFMELLFSLGLATSGEIGAKLLHGLFGMLLAATLYDYARKYLSAFWSAAATLILMTVPTLMVMMSWAYVDLAFAWFVLMAWVCSENFFSEKKSKWAVYAGLFCGAACCVKYTGIQWTLLLAILSLLRGVTHKQLNSTLRFLVLQCGLAGIILAPYLFRNYWMTGWVLYPFSGMGLLMREGLNWDLERTHLFLGWVKSFGAPLDAPPLFVYGLSLVRIFVDGEFNNPARFEGIIGPLFLLIPVLFVFGKMKAFPRSVAAITLLFLYYWLVTTRQARFFIPALPFLSLMLVYGLSQLRPSAARLIFAVGLVFNLICIVQFWAHKQPWPYLAGKETRAEYLARQHAVFSMYAAVNRLMPKDGRVYLVNMKNYGYYLSVPWDADFIFERYSLEQLLKKPDFDEALNLFFQEKGMTHVLIDFRPLQSPESGLEPGDFEKLKNYLHQFAQPIALKEDVFFYVLNPDRSNPRY